MDDEKAIEPLIKTLNDEKASVKYAAAVGLLGIGDERAIKPLEKAVEDKNPMVNKVAQVALKSIKERL